MKNSIHLLESFLTKTFWANIGSWANQLLYLTFCTISRRLRTQLWFCLFSSESCGVQLPFWWSLLWFRVLWQSRHHWMKVSFHAVLLLANVCCVVFRQADTLNCKIKMSGDAWLALDAGMQSTVELEEQNHTAQMAQATKAFAKSY